MIISFYSHNVYVHVLMYLCVSGVEGNPYVMNTGKRLERTMSVKLRPAGRVIKSQERTGIKRVSSLHT